MVRTVCVLGVLVVLGTSLEAGAESQVETLLYDTHRKVTNLNDNLDGAIKNLNETTTQLVSRVDETEVQTRQLRSMMEENQVKLDVLEKQLGELTTTIYRQFNLTAGGKANPAAGLPGTDSVAIVPPVAPGVPGAPGAPVEAGTPLETAAEPAPEATGASSPSSGAAHSVYQQAQKVWLSDDYAGALQQFTDFLARYPDTDLAGNAQYWQGRCYLKLERYEEAVSAFQNVRTKYPENDSKVSQAMQSQAVALSRLGRNDEAEKLLKEVVTKYPTTSAARQAESDLAKLRGN
jgi:tol-pal system protein YbgF